MAEVKEENEVVIRDACLPVYAPRVPQELRACREQ